MGTGTDPTLAETAEKLHRFADRLEKANQPTNTNTVSTVFNAGGLGMLLGFAIGIGGAAMAYGMYVRAEARELVMAAERKADLRELSTLKRDVATIQAYTTLHGQKITKLEAESGEHPER